MKGRGFLAALAASLLLPLLPLPAQAWGDEGHEIIGLIAQHDLEPAVREKLRALLERDGSGLTADTGIAAEATWADRFRDSDRDADRLHYRQTHEWHYVDLEISAPNLDTACFQHPALPANSSASEGPARDCIVDKIDQFRHELADPATSPAERQLALQFLLHLIGDLHQPLHASDARDRGGNDKQVSAAGERAGTLHYYWDTVFVERAGRDPTAVARELIADISWWQRRAWRRGSTADWAMQSFEIAKTQVYGKLPRARGDGTYPLDERYVRDASLTVRRQLQIAGVRLARVLNDALR